MSTNTKTYIKFVSLFCLVVISACADVNHEQTHETTEPSGNLPQTPTPSKEEKLFDAKYDSFVNDALVRYQVPGAAVAVISKGKVIHQKGYGVRSVESQEPVTTDTAFLVGSLNKSMTTLMMATLVDDGLLDWEQPVTDFIPSFSLSEPSYTARIRVRDLVNHSSGVPAYDTPFLLEYQPPTQLIESIKDIPVVAEPGKMFNYCNQTFATGGFVAAVAAGAPYTDAGLYSKYLSLMQERVFEPIGMRDTTLDMDVALTRKHALPHGYDVAAKASRPFSIDSERFLKSVAPAGAVWSTVEDLGRYAIAQLHGTGLEDVAWSRTRICTRPGNRKSPPTSMKVMPLVGSPPRRSPRTDNPPWFTREKPLALRLQ
jgi:CubicO group peptidase (beta-lactamase class C family)